MKKNNWRSSLGGVMRKSKPKNLDEDWKKSRTVTKVANIFIPIKGIREKGRSISEKYQFRKSLLLTLFGGFKAFAIYAYETFLLLFFGKKSSSVIKSETRKVFNQEEKLEIAKQALKLIFVWVLVFGFWLFFVKQSYLNSGQFTFFSSAHFIFGLITFYTLMYLVKCNNYSGRLLNALRYYLCFFFKDEDSLKVSNDDYENKSLSPIGLNMLRGAFVFFIVFTLIVLSKLLYNFFGHSHFSGLFSLDNLVLVVGVFLTVAYGKLYWVYK